jgi:hypothetical protein
MSKKISNVALLTFEGAAFNVTFLAILLILVYPLNEGKSVFAIKSRFILLQRKAVDHESPFKLDLPFMVLDLVYAFQMSGLRET